MNQNPYNTRRKHSLSHKASPIVHNDTNYPRKRAKRDSFYAEQWTPPPSPPSSGLQLYDDDLNDPILIGIVSLLERSESAALCSREISESLLAEGKIQFSSNNTPSTLINASISQHLKRCSANQQSPLIDKVSDPKYPRRTLYHLALFKPSLRQETSLESTFGSPPPHAQSTTPISITDMPIKMEMDKESRASSPSPSSDDESDFSDSLSNDGQGPFAAPIEARQRMRMSPTPELDFNINLDAAQNSIATPSASKPSSPVRTQKPQVNIAAPPSPFRAGSDDEEEKVSRFTGNTDMVASTFARSRETMYFRDISVASPEKVGLDELDDIFQSFDQ